MRKADAKLNVQHVCQLFDVPISSYYKQQEVVAINIEKEFIISRIIDVHNNNLQSYGRRRMFKSLQIEGINIGIFKVAKLMREAGVVAKIPKKPHYYPAGNEKPNTPNLLKREFNPETMNTHWVGDITYIRSYQGWSYLATVLDLGTKEIVGYALSKTPDAQLAKQALINAIAFARPDTRKLMFHSDQGVQYSANLFKSCLVLHCITQSMSRRGNCWDNAVQERFFRSLKSEYLNGLSFINHDSVVSAVTYYIRYYNNKRLNSTIDYIAPAQKRRMLCNVA